MAAKRVTLWQWPAFLLLVMVVLACGKKNDSKPRGEQPADEDDGGSPSSTDGGSDSGSSDDTPVDSGKTRIAGTVAVDGVVRVVAFDGEGGAKAANVAADGTFAVDVEEKRSYGVVFVDADGQSQGYLALSTDIETVPLGKTADQVVSVGTLAVDAGLRVTSGKASETPFQFSETVMSSRFREPPDPDHTEQGDEKSRYGTPNLTEIPPAGTYVIDYGGKSMAFTLPDQSAFLQNFIVMVPTITLRNDGTVAKVAWRYQLASDPAAELDPAAVIDGAPKFHLDGTGTACAGAIGGDHLYDYDQETWTAGTTEQSLTCTTLVWTQVTSVVMGYNDLYGNSFSVEWTK